jgi:ribose 1,5-bisphosphokinase PhnN
VWTIHARTDRLGYFAAGYPAGSISNGSSQILPVTVALLIVVVLVGGVPLAILRRRQTARGGENEEDGS